MGDKITAVDWLQNCLNIHLSFEQKMQFEGLFQQAIEMEMEQKVESYKNGYANGQMDAFNN